MQRMFNNLDDFKNYIQDNNFRNCFVVCSHSFYGSDIHKILEDAVARIVYFDDYCPNPKYESVIKGLELFNHNNCDSIIAIGGGSAIDVAKCIKNESGKDSLKLLASPTTAGTGSESTKFAVIYKDGKKTSVENECLLPDAVLFYEKMLKTLPLRQKKATALDAFSHSIESMWSINSTEESMELSKKAILLLQKNMDRYFCGDEGTYKEMFEAANLAGRAINITKTTAGHAMCYKLTSLYGVPHGQAAMIVNSELLPYMVENIDSCVDKRGKEYLLGVFKDIGKLIADDSFSFFRLLLSKTQMYDFDINIDDLDELVDSVNIERLSNNPVKLSKDDIREIYLRIIREIEKNKQK